jgi:uncharacterized protein (DUF58 family)
VVATKVNQWVPDRNLVSIRNYQPGDDLRQLDWKMFARTERYYIKEAEIETNITVKFMLDASHSMAYTEDGVSKTAICQSDDCRARRISHESKGIRLGCLP